MKTLLAVLLLAVVCSAQIVNNGAASVPNGVTNAANSLPANQVIVGNTYPDTLTTNCTIGVVATDAEYCPGGFFGAAQTATSDATAPVAHEAMKWVATNGWTLATTTDGANPSLTIANANAASSLVRPEAAGSQVSAVFDGYVDGTGSSSTTVGQYAILSTHINGQLAASTTCPAGTMSFGTWAESAAAGIRTLNYLPRMCVPNQIKTCAITLGDGTNVMATGDISPFKQGSCYIPYPATITEVELQADTGTTSVLVEKRTGATTVADVMSAALAANGNTRTCARTGTSATCYDGTTSDGTVTVKTSASANVLAAGDIIEIKSGTADGTTKALRVYVSFTIN